MTGRKDGHYLPSTLSGAFFIGKIMNQPSQTKEVIPVVAPAPAMNLWLRKEYTPASCNPPPVMRAGAQDHLRYQSKGV